MGPGESRGMIARSTRAAFPAAALLAAFLVCAALLAAQGGLGLWRSGRSGGSSSVPAEPYSVHFEGIRDPSRADLSRMTRAVVTRIVDGDTVVVEIPSPPEGLRPRENVRLIGVDAPELPRKGRSGDAGAEFARAEAERLLKGRRMLLAFDRELRDRYDRVLAYLYSVEGVCLNRELVASGAARALLKYPFAFSAAFRDAEREARGAGRGHW